MTVSVTLVSGQTAVVGVASSREAYEVEVTSGIAGPSGVSVAGANVVGGMLNMTMSNGAVINAGSVALTPNTGTITFTGNIIGQLSNGTVDIQGGNNIWSFNTNGSLTFPDNTSQTTAWTGTGNISFSNTTIAVTNNTSNTSLTMQVYCSAPSASPPYQGVRSFIFGSDGSVEYPDNTKQYTAWVPFDQQLNTSNNVSFSGVLSPYFAFGGGIEVTAGVGGPQTAGWMFNEDGSMSFPDSTLQTTAYTRSVTTTMINSQTTNTTGLLGADTIVVRPDVGYMGSDTQNLQFLGRAVAGMRTLLINTSTLCTVNFDLGVVITVDPITVTEVVYDGTDFFPISVRSMV